ncbi:MAG: hypothetical protein OER82_08705 [Nitrosopumilus sp.]|nr:hypothetical protein [Nitrosopumilus sp.]
MDPLEFETEKEGSVTETTYTELPDYVKKESNKANNAWNRFVNQLDKLGYEPRATVILCQVVIEYYINRVLLLLNQKIKNENNKEKRFDEKLKIIKNLNFLNEEYHDDLLVLYEIRNIYAHEIEISKPRIKHKLNSIKHLKHVTRDYKTTEIGKHYFRLFDSYRKGLQRGFMELLIKEIEKQDTDSLDDFFEKITK